MIRRSLKLAPLALAFSLFLSHPSAVEASVDRKVPATATGVSYDEGITCEALYILFVGQYEEGSEVYTELASLYSLWHSFMASFYPTGFEEHNDTDVHARVTGLIAEFQTLDDEAFEMLAGNYFSHCEQLEEVELYPRLQ